jgi:hypothetical protein
MFGQSTWDSGCRAKAISLDEKPIRWRIDENEKPQWVEDQGGLNVDATQRLRQGDFLMPPVLPVVLVMITIDEVRAISRDRHH